MPERLPRLRSGGIRFQTRFARMAAAIPGTGCSCGCDLSRTAVDVPHEGSEGTRGNGLAKTFPGATEERENLLVSVVQPPARNVSDHSGDQPSAVGETTMPSPSA